MRPFVLPLLSVALALLLKLTRLQLSLAAFILLVAPPAYAGDGRTEINQAIVDAAGGFPFTISSPGSYVLTSDLAATSRLPREMLHSMGIINFFHWIPGFDAFLANEQALSAFRILTGLALAACGLGLGAPFSAPAAAVCSLVYFGIFWHYTYFYHQGLFALTMIAALAFTPCADALSLDRKLGRRLRARGPRDYAWGRYLCWTVLALPYALAGLSKLRNGGLGWWDRGL